MKDWEDGELIDLDDGGADGYEEYDEYDGYDDSEFDVYNDNAYEEEEPEERVRRPEPKSGRRAASGKGRERRSSGNASAGRRKKKANKDFLTRLKHSAISFLVAIVLIALVIWIAFGARIKESIANGEHFGVHFLLSVLYPEKYSYSSETYDLKEYFKVFAADDIAITLQDEPYGVQKTGESYERSDKHTLGKLFGDTQYFSFETVEDLFTDRFYYNETEGVLLYSTKDSVVTVQVGDDSRYYESGSVRTDVPYRIAVVGTDGTLYVAADYVKLYADFDYSFYPGEGSTPNRMQVYTKWDTQRVATVAKDTRVRYRGGIKSEILCQVEKGDELVILEMMENWCRVKTQDCFIGYIEKDKLSEVREQAQSPAAGAYHPETDYAMTPPEERILLGFQQLDETRDDGAGMKVLTADATGLNVVSPTWYYLNSADGGFISCSSVNYVAAAHERGYQVWALVENMSHGRGAEFDEYDLFSSSEHRKALIDALMEEANSIGFDGINMDMEFSDAALAKTGEHYVQFLRELSIACHAEGIVLSVDVPVPTASNRAYDLHELGYVTDYVIVMAYDEHWDGSDAGSVASIGFVENGIRNTIEAGVPAEKVVCAIPFYTRIWCTEGESTSSRAVFMATAQQWLTDEGVTAAWDEETCQNYAEKQDGASTYRVWLEDEESMKARLGVVTGLGVHSVAAWRLGMESEGLWDLINGELH